MANVVGRKLIQEAYAILQKAQAEMESPRSRSLCYRALIACKDLNKVIRNELKERTPAK